MNLKEFKIQDALGLITFKDRERLAKESKNKKLLYYLAFDKYSYVRHCVAGNKNCHLEVLGKD